MLLPTRTSFLFARSVIVDQNLPHTPSFYLKNKYFHLEVHPWELQFELKTSHFIRDRDNCWPIRLRNEHLFVCISKIDKFGYTLEGLLADLPVEGKRNFGNDIIGILQGFTWEATLEWSVWYKQITSSKSQYHA